MTSYKSIRGKKGDLEDSNLRIIPLQGATKAKTSPPTDNCRPTTALYQGFTGHGEPVNAQ